jgi:predicted permease
VRGSLGASRWQLARRALCESLLLSLLGGGLGVALAAVGTRSLVELGREFLPATGRVGVDGTVFAFAAALALAAAVLSGLAPALGGARVDLGGTLRSGGRAGEGRSAVRARQRLVAAELALAAVVVAGTLLLLRSMAALHGVDPGFSAAGVTTAAISLPAASYPDEASLTAFQERFLERVQALPGVERAALTRRLPLADTGWSSDFAIAGRGREEYGIEVLHAEVSAGYFDVMAVPLLAGATFSGAETATAPPVVIVNAAFAERWFGGRSPVGQRICFDRYPTAGSVWRTIVGVVGSERQTALATAPRPEVFAPLAQEQARGMHLVVKAALPPATLVPSLRAALRAVDPGLPLFEVRAMEEVVGTSLARERFLLTLFALFAAVAVVLAALGVYGVTAEAVAARRREVGLRLAVGARAPQVVVLVLRHQALAAIAGVTAGMAGALGLGQSLRGLLYGVGPADATSFGAAVAILALVSLVAAWLPARRVARVPPLTALR